MKIFTAQQIHDLDKYTIEHEPIDSINLMERAAMVMTDEIKRTFEPKTPFVVFAGPGNNGGDALAIARLLANANYDVSVYLFNISGHHLSDDCETNRKRLEECRSVKTFVEVRQEFDPPQLSADIVVIDGLFGSGLNKTLSGGFASLVKYINASQAKVVSIDIPSGLMPEDNTYNVRANMIRADITLTLHQKKLSFFFAENQQITGEVRTLDIGLHEKGMEEMSAVYSIMEENEVCRRLLTRDDFAHKGQMGNALLVAGSAGMCGAAILAAKACYRSGAGKVAVRSPRRNTPILQAAIPEAIVRTDPNEYFFSEPTDTEMYDALGVGPGIGQTNETAIALIAQLRSAQCPIVADADALNILGNRKAWMQQLPKGVIMTPHPKEFDRMQGNSTNSYERLQKARGLAQHIQGYIILKGHYSALCLPDGNVELCPTGNAGMATAGSGDVLTGIITGLLARGYKQHEAAAIGMYVHGLAGDIAAEKVGIESLMASDIIDCLPQAFMRLYAKKAQLTIK
ncbi:MAG: NAD(P)H-hydrate dehydratase [Prevotella sp.]|nr:NAD(P)H-hydrate dehydratase [Prevotella sp.]